MFSEVLTGEPVRAKSLSCKNVRSKMDLGFYSFESFAMSFIKPEVKSNAEVLCA